MHFSLIKKIKNWYFNKKYKKMIEETKRMIYIQKYLEKRPRSNFNLAHAALRLYKQNKGE